MNVTDRITSVALLKALISNAAAVTAAWAPVAITLRALVALAGGPLLPRQLWVPFVLRQVIVGAITGIVLSGALVTFGRRRAFTDLTSTRMALCGALGGATFPVAWYSIMRGPTSLLLSGSGLVIATGAALGALLAGGVLMVARRAPVLPPAEAFAAEITSGR